MSAGSLSPAEKLRIEDLLERGALDAAEQALDEALDAGMADPVLFHLKGLARSFRREYGQAKHWLERAVSASGGHWLYLKNLGVIHYHLGEIDSAVECFEGTLQRRPRDFESYGFLADARTFRERPALLDTMEALLDQPGLGSLQRSNLHFAAGKIYDDLRDPDKAFRHFELANRLSHRRADLDAVESEVSMLIETYTKADFPGVVEERATGFVPVFVVGMPRSGTSLMEQIISSHPLGAGVGELPDIRMIHDRLNGLLAGKGGYPRGRSHLDEPDVAALATRYRKTVSGLLGPVEPGTRAVDKSPLNFWHLGLIADLFPDAKIVHMRRDPLDTCVSCYFTQFLSQQEFAFDLEQLGRYYLQYAKLMSHWAEVMPQRFITVDYEALVRDIPGQSRRVTDYLGLEWDEACAAPHRSRNIMQTASARQVRQPVYTTSIGRWKPYRAFLDPLIRVLENGGVSLPG